MPHDLAHEHGSIDAVFAHRFVLKRADGSRVLADLGPKGVDAFTLDEGAEVSIVGERKPSEIKVTRIASKDGEPIDIRQGGPADAPAEGGEADPASALAAVVKAGVAPLGEPRRKPKHFEVLARRGDALVELHVDFGGGVRTEKPADRAKWADALAGR